jgi:hypothetical protein
MAILSESDRSRYFPLVKLAGEALAGAIERAQVVAERHAMRPLELTQFTEVCEVPPSKTFPLKYQPIDQTKPIEVEVSAFGRGDFTQIGANDFAIEDGTITLHRPGRRVRIKYWSGLQDVPAVKSAIASILYYQVLS